MKTHAERFRHLLEVWGLTQEELGKLCGIKRGTVGTIVNSKTTPDADALGELLRNKPDLSPDWLLNGVGPMLREGRQLQPFLPGGEASGFGNATALPRGGLAASFPSGLGEDVDGAGPKAALPTDAKGFIKQLLAEVEALKTENKSLQAVIGEQREMLKESRENAQFLRQQLASAGKGLGSQEYAPVAYAVAEPAPASIGFGRVRQMWPTTPMRVSHRRAA